MANQTRNSAIKSLIRVFHVIHSLYSNKGGPSRSCIALTDSLSKFPNLRITLISQVFPGKSPMNSLSKSVYRKNQIANSKISDALGCPIRNFLYSLKHTSVPHLFYCHGLWSPVTHWCATASKKYNVPLIIQPHGMLEPWALRYNFYKKYLALFFYQKRNLNLAKLFIATSNQEYESIRKLGFKQPVAIIPNGINLDFTYAKELIKFPLNRQRKILFISRIHPKKGLENLLDALSKISISGWKLIIAGPDESGHINQVYNKLKKINLTIDVEYIGEVEGLAKENLFKNSDLFVLPTFSENFGIVIAEALSYGLPVITTRGAPWQDLHLYNCGWWIDIGVDPLFEALNQALNMSDEQRIKMGRNGQKYIRRYDYNIISQQMYDSFSWLLSGKNKPSFIKID